MTRPLILHIGLPKTGTSSIQRILAGQREALQALGVYYPYSPGRVNHALLPAYLVNDKRRLWAFHPGNWEGLPPEVRLERFAEEWRVEMATLPDWAERVVMSSELISGLLRDENEVARLADMLRPHFDPIRVVVYLRRQDQHAASAYSQQLRNGSLRPPALPDARSAEEWLLDAAALMARFAGAFGQAAMQPRIFERGRLLNGDVVADFLHVADIAMVAPADSRHRESNPGLRIEAQQLLLLMGQRMAAQGSGSAWRNSPSWLRLAVSVSESLPGRGWRPTGAEARAFMAQFEAGNEIVRQRYFPGQAALFSGDFGDALETDAAVDESRLRDAAVTALLHEMAAAARADGKAAMAEYRLARQMQDRPLMITTLTRAVALAPDDPAARIRLAELLLDEGAFAQAGAQAGLALLIDPASRPAQRLQHRARRAALGKPYGQEAKPAGGAGRAPVTGAAPETAR